MNLGGIMPTVKNGKVSLNLKVNKDMYDKWVKAACQQGIMNMSEFIRLTVSKAIGDERS